MVEYFINRLNIKCDQCRKVLIVDRLIPLYAKSCVKFLKVILRYLFKGVYLFSCSLLLHCMEF